VFVVRHEADLPDARSSFEVESSRAYADRLVLKLKGVDDARAAVELKGRIILAPQEAVPALPAGEYFVARLIGLEVRDESGCPMGRVTDVWETGGADLVVITASDGSEWMLPLAAELVVSISEEEGVMTVRPPKGLLEGQYS
jgi:16S rRNA processing protein RimM